MPFERQIIRDGEKPAQFVNRIIAERQAAAKVDEPKPIDAVIEQAKADVAKEAAPTQPAQEPAPKFDFVPKKEGPEPVQAQQQQESTQQSQPDSDDQEPAPGSLSANYKILKTTYKETKQNLLKLSEEKARVEKELEDYKTGVVVPQVLQEKENEIARLQSYERLFNVKGTKAYKEQVLDPLVQNQNELKQLFKDYEIPEDQITAFSALTNRADRNRFLSDHFDQRGADQAEQLLQKGAAFKQRAKDLETGAASAVQELEAEHQRIEAARDVERKAKIAENAKDSWVRAIHKIRSEGKIKELIPKSNDPEFNQNIVNPILTAASVEYGKFVSHLAASGVKELTPEMAEYAARMSLLAHASAVTTATRDAALEHAAELEAANKRNNVFIRPTIGGGVPRPSTAPAPKQTLEQGIDSVLSQVMKR